MKTLLSILGVVVVIGLVVVGSFVSNYNYGNVAEKSIQAEYTNMENILAQYSLKVSEVAQVPGLMADDLKEVVAAAMSGRYGDDGSKATFQWIQEAYPGQVDPAVYTKIQQVMEAGRNQFQNAQTKFVDTKRAYETNLGYLYKGFWLRVAGYPTIDLDEYVIISSDHAKEAFDTKIDKGLVLE